MPSGPITSWQIEGEKVETVTDFIFLGSRITVDDDCSHEIERCLLHGRKARTNLNSVLKSRDIALPTKVHIFKAKVLPVSIQGWFPLGLIDFISKESKQLSIVFSSITISKHQFFSAQLIIKPNVTDPENTLSH